MITLTLEYIVENKDNLPIQPDKTTENIISIFNTKLSTDLLDYEHYQSTKFNLKKSENLPGERHVNTSYVRKSFYKLIFAPLNVNTCLKTIHSIIADLDEKPNKIVINNE